MKENRLAYASSACQCLMERKEPVLCCPNGPLGLQRPLDSCQLVVEAHPFLLEALDNGLGADDWPTQKKAEQLPGCWNLGCLWRVARTLNTLPCGFSRLEPSTGRL